MLTIICLPATLDARSGFEKLTEMSSVVPPDVLTFAANVCDIQKDSSAVGVDVGTEVGACVGVAVGVGVGIAVGSEVGACVGTAVGVSVGIAVGVGVGEDVSNLVTVESTLTLPSEVTPAWLAKNAINESSDPSSTAAYNSALTLLRTSSSCCAESTATSMEIETPDESGVRRARSRRRADETHSCSPKFAGLTPEMSWAMARLTTAASVVPYASQVTPLSPSVRSRFERVSPDGSGVGAGVGMGDGTNVGAGDGSADGAGVGTVVGVVLGTGVGAGVGAALGVGTQRLPMHARVWQSSSSPQVCPNPQRAQSPPPQSMSVSAPSKTSFTHAASVGIGVGRGTGTALGIGTGTAVGAGVGICDGVGVGASEGSRVGSALGNGLGTAVGAVLGAWLGAAVGI
jgi:hypothetical protein